MSLSPADFLADLEARAVEHGEAGGWFHSVFFKIDVNTRYLVGIPGTEVDRRTLRDILDQIA